MPALNDETETETEHAVGAATEAAEGPPRRELGHLRAREVTVTELDRSASRVIAAVIEGEAAAVTRHGRPVALVLPLADAVLLLPPYIVMGGELGGLSRRFVERERHRLYSQLGHGRWYYAEGLKPGQRRARGPKALR